MRKYKQLLEERAELYNEQQDMVKTAQSEKRELNETEATRFDDLQSQMDAMDPGIKRAKIIWENELREAGETQPLTSGIGLGQSEERERIKMRSKYDLHKAIRSQLPNGILDGVEKEIHEETQRRAQEANITISGLAVPTDFLKEQRSGSAGQTVTKDNGDYGGNLVDTQLESPIEFLRPEPILERLGARFLSGLTGNLKFPTNEGGISGSWEGEVDQGKNSRNAYGSKEMKPNRYVTSALISLQNLMQSSIDLQMFTVEDIRRVTANALDYAGINGSGTNGIPLGILNTKGINIVEGGANGAKPEWSHIVDLETGINEANANIDKMAYLFNSSTKGVLKKTKHSSGDLNYLMNGVNEVNGYKVGVSNLVPKDLSKGTGDGLSAGIFGDFSQLLIGQWAFLDLTVDNISRKKEGYIELVVNSFLDTLVRQPKAFSVIKDWII
ncbi:phage major capsid protein [Tenacibaculum sp. nBUS_03]|uniref:phage major capsid protein n=1 Tax=Tenacibaculum sp. nBUS_03 TaxID=3395320 RepID=UPI003EB93F3D